MQMEMMQHLRALLLDLQEYSETTAYVQAQQENEVDNEDLPQVNIMLSRLHQIIQKLNNTPKTSELQSSLKQLYQGFNQNPKTEGSVLQAAKDTKQWNVQLIQAALHNTQKMLSVKN